MLELPCLELAQPKHAGINKNILLCVYLISPICVDCMRAMSDWYRSYCFAAFNVYDGIFVTRETIVSPSPRILAK